MLRRDYATFIKQWHGAENVTVRCSSEDIDVKTYLERTDNPSETISVIVGDVQRVVEYPKLGFQIDQEVPQVVMQAYNKLVERGYSAHLI